MDGFFQKMLLLQKKKYAAISVTEKDGKVVSSFMETKGLDLVRRDWCGLSHDVSQFILQQIFASDREEAVQRIHTYLGTVGQEVREGLVPIAKYVITKSLTKNPEEYADKKNQPHVQVAMHMKSQGKAAKNGDIIPYIICKGSETTLAARAHHPDELTGENPDKLEVDFNWYLANQIHPPVSRLCAPIEGTDIPRLANCLGLDISKYHQSTATADAEELYTFESTITDEERFKDVQKWTPRCLHCGQHTEFKCDFACSNCNNILPVGSLSLQLTASMRTYMSKYLCQSVVCEDPACGTATRSSSVFGRRCLMTGCKGFVNLQVIWC